MHKDNLLSSSIALLVLLLLGFIVYSSSLSNGFVLDDEAQIVYNPAIHDLKRVGDLFLGSTMAAEGATHLNGVYYKPLMSLTTSLLWWLSPNEAFAFHLFQLLLVIANCFLLYLLFQHFFLKPLALLLACLFLLHPLNSEVVVYIADLQDPLYFFFGISALNLCLRCLSEKSRLLTLSSFLLLGALLSKESGILFFALIPLALWIFGKLNLKIWSLSAGVALSIYLYLRIFAAGLTSTASQINLINRASYSERLLTAPKVIFSYLWKFIDPAEITITQDWLIKTPDLLNFWLPLILLLAILTLCGWWFKKSKDKVFLFFFCWTVIGLGFHSHILVPLDGTVADRWFYLPMVGLLGMLAQIALRIPEKKRSLAGFVVVLIGLGWGVRSYYRSVNWQDNFTLCVHDLEILPDSYFLQNNVGTELFRRGQIQEAKSYFERSIELAPQWDMNWNNLGAFYEHFGNYDKARELYSQAVSNGSLQLAYVNLANLLARQKDWSSLQKFLDEKALKIYPGHPLFQQLNSLAHEHMTVR